MYVGRGRMSEHGRPPLRRTAPSLSPDHGETWWFQSVINALFSPKHAVAVMQRFTSLWGVKVPDSVFHRKRFGFLRKRFLKNRFRGHFDSFFRNLYFLPPLWVVVVRKICQSASDITISQENTLNSVGDILLCKQEFVFMRRHSVVRKMRGGWRWWNRRLHPPQHLSPINTN